jgi:hypothetical protein
MRINNIDELPPRLRDQVESKLGKLRQSKYGNVKTYADGIVFHSAKEAVRFGELKLLFDAGEISTLMIQQPFKLAGGGLYIADFVYYDKNCRGWIVEDVKGYRTKEYKIKKKLMLEIGIEIQEI